MEIHFSKWGNSLAVRIPAVLAKHYNLADGSSAILVAEDGQMVIRVPKKHKYSLDEMIESMKRAGPIESEWSDRETEVEADEWVWDEDD